jgi:hypothetical protein
VGTTLCTDRDAADKIITLNRAGFFGFSRRLSDAGHVGFAPRKLTQTMALIAINVFCIDSSLRQPSDAT